MRLELQFFGGRGSGGGRRQESSTGSEATSSARQPMTKQEEFDSMRDEVAETGYGKSYSELSPQEKYEVDSSLVEASSPGEYTGIQLAPNPKTVKSAAEKKSSASTKATSFPEFNGQRESGTYMYEGKKVKVTVTDRSTSGERSVTTTWDLGKSRDLHVVQYDFGRWGGKSRYEVRGKNRNGGYYRDFGNIYAALEYVRKHKYEDFYK